MSSTRSSRNTVTNLDTISRLSARERLLIAQAVYEYGADAWLDISRVLSKHPLISRPKGFFSPQACQTIYMHLMGEAGYECSDETHAPHAHPNLKLAQRHYRARVVELRSLILAEEEKFKTLTTEIDDIRAGRWDQEIAKELGISIQSPKEETEFSLRTSEDQQVTETANINAVVESRDPNSLLEGTAEGKILLSELPQGQQNSVSVEQPILHSSPIPPVSEAGEDMSLGEDGHEQADRQLDIVVQSSSALPSEDKSTVAEPATIPQDERIQMEADTKAATPVFEEITSTVELKCDDKPSSPVSLREHRTQEELKAIEALEELSRQKSVDVMPHRVCVIEPPSNVCEKQQAEEEAMATEDHASPIPQSNKDESLAEEQNKPFANKDFGTTVAARSILNGKRKFSEVEATADNRDKKKTRDDSVPTEDDDTGRRRLKMTRDETNVVSTKRFQAVITMLHSQISQHRNGNIFHNPIKDSEAPDYHEIVKRPMDLKTIKTRIKDGGISNSDDFQKEIYLMFANAMMYNRPKSDIYRMAQEMLIESEEHIRDFRQTEGFLSRGKR